MERGNDDKNGKKVRLMTGPDFFIEVVMNYFLVLSLKVATRLNSTCSKSLSVAPIP